MATLKSQNDRLLVLREGSAHLPDLNESSGGSFDAADGVHRDVTVVSQFQDEPLDEYAERVMVRVTRDLRQGVVYRGVVIALGERMRPCASECQRLVHSLAAMLALRPNGAVRFFAPVSADSTQRLELLELAGSVARGAPHLDVNVAFPEAKPAKLRKRIKASRAIGLGATAQG